ncbi:MAG: hypothetical protein NT027_03755 [Proteobacteria bacterium]|nr:hypothetical protein [Pseudomonadota bacterium]
MKILKALVTFALAAGLMHCTKGNNDSLSKSKLEEKQKQAAKAPPEAKSIEVPDLFSSSKTNIQTRGVLTLRLSDTYIDDITELSLFNDTTKATIVDHQPISLGLVSGRPSFQMTQQAADVIVKIYPGLPATRQKMKYGNNSLRLVTVAADEERFSSQRIRLIDFKYFSAAYMSGGDEEGTENPMISGGFTPFAQGVSAASGGGSFLFTNAAHILTH